MPSNSRIRGFGPYVAYIPPPDHKVYRPKNPRASTRYVILTKPSMKSRWYMYAEEKTKGGMEMTLASIDTLTCPYVKVDRVESKTVEYRRIL